MMGFSEIIANENIRADKNKKDQTRDILRLNYYMQQIHIHGNIHRKSAMSTHLTSKHI